MKIWLMREKLDNMEIAFANDNEFNRNAYELNSMKMWDALAPIEMKVIKKGKDKNFPYFMGGIPVFNKKIVDILDPLIKEHVEYLPIKLVNMDIEQDYQILNITNVVYGVDYLRSIPNRNLRGFVNGFDKRSFINEKVRDQMIFLVPEYSTQVFVSDKVRDAVLGAKLKGFDFDEVWDMSGEDEVLDPQLLSGFLGRLEYIEKNKGKEFGWAEVYDLVQQDKAFASGKWRVQIGKYTENIIIGQMGIDCELNWVSKPILPSEFGGLLWHEVDKLDI